jgi:hypothetical protein
MRVVGDIARTPDQQKSESDETDELQILEYLLDETVPELRSAGLLAEIKSILLDPDSSLVAQAFHDAELLGYYETGIVAAYRALLETQHRQAGHTKRDDTSYEQLLKFGKKVPLDWYQHIEQAAQTFPYMKLRLDATLPFLEYAHQQHGWDFSVSAIG